MDDAIGPGLLGRTLDELRAIAAEAALPPFAADQLAGWLYRQHATGFEEMTNLPKAARAALAARYDVGRCPPAAEAVSSDGTKKYLFPTAAGGPVETAFIPDAGRATLCVSTQSGCRRACRFCHTGRIGFYGNLTAGEILNQYASLPERDAVTNLVFMGMGEPLDNLDATLRSVGALTAAWGYAMSPTRITVSTIGLLPALQRLIDETRVHIALSLHSPFPDERRRFLPAEGQHPAAAAIDALRRARIGGQRRVMIEYIGFAGVNDTPRHAEALARLLRGLRCRVNLIPFNPWPGAPLAPSPRAALEAFQHVLKARDIMTTIRRSRGADIAAACGMLRGEREA
jgi:23S rRNA (adenine2503-C2)-methyltransferase